jgi:DNA-binding XRE family transcriptional regulator
LGPPRKDLRDAQPCSELVIYSTMRLSHGASCTGPCGQGCVGVASTSASRLRFKLRRSPVGVNHKRTQRCATQIAVDTQAFDSIVFFKMPDEILRAFGKHLRQVRKKSGLSQERLAELADVHRNYTGRVERGGANPTLLVIVALAHALKVRPSKLLEKLR